MTYCHLFQVVVKEARRLKYAQEVSLYERGDNGVLTTKPIQFNLPLYCPGRSFICDISVYYAWCWLNGWSGELGIL